MKFNYSDLGKQVVNSVIGFLIGDKAIPLGSKGEITSIQYETEEVYVKWLVGEKKVSTCLTFAQFTKLIESGVIQDVLEYEEPPQPKFGVGDIVKGSTVLGVVKSRKFDGVGNTWLYTIIQFDGMLYDDNILRFDTVEEDYIEKVDGEVNIDIDFKNNKIYELKIQEK